MSAAARENARRAVLLDHVRIVAESAERRASRRLWRAVVLAPSLEVCEALLAGEDVPVDALDPEALARFRPDADDGAASACARIAPSAGRTADIGGDVSEAVRFRPDGNGGAAHARIAPSSGRTLPPSADEEAVA